MLRFYTYNTLTVIFPQIDFLFTDVNKFLLEVAKLKCGTSTTIALASGQPHKRHKATLSKMVIEVVISLFLSK